MIGKAPKHIAEGLFFMSDWGQPYWPNRSYKIYKTYKIYKIYTDKGAG